MIRSLVASIAIVTTAFSSQAAEATWLPIEKQVKEIVASKDVTIVHFWAPWCGNCIAEKRDNGWAGFIERNPDVKFVFIESWNDGKDSREALAKYNLGAQPNLTVLAHPGPRRGAERMRTFLDMPVTWTPTTWVFREGRLCFAFNYGEIRFPILQQLTDDTQADW
jgi:thiol-disulfide isomerase/thioredoxin